MVAIQVTAFPEFFAGLRVQTGCAVGAEVHVDSPLFNDRGRGGMCVEVIVFGLRLGHVEDLDVVHLFPGLKIDANGEHFGAVHFCGRYPNLILPDNGGGPTKVMNWGSPLHVLCAGKLNGEVGIRGVCVIGPTELIPVRVGAQACGHCHCHKNQERVNFFCHECIETSGLK